MTFFHVYNNDAYEITHDGDRIVDVIRYRDKLTVIGERFSFDDLPEKLQTQLLKHLTEANE